MAFFVSSVESAVESGEKKEEQGGEEEEEPSEEGEITELFFYMPESEGPAQVDDPEGPGFISDNTIVESHAVVINYTALGRPRISVDLPEGMPALGPMKISYSDNNACVGFKYYSYHSRDKSAKITLTHQEDGPKQVLFGKCLVRVKGEDEDDLIKYTIECKADGRCFLHRWEHP